MRGCVMTIYKREVRGEGKVGHCLILFVRMRESQRIRNGRDDNLSNFLNTLSSLNVFQPNPKNRPRRRRRREVWQGWWWCSNSTNILLSLFYLLLSLNSMALGYKLNSRSPLSLSLSQSMLWLFKFTATLSV